jgi:hypothetical protein
MSNETGAPQNPTPAPGQDAVGSPAPKSVMDDPNVTGPSSDKSVLDGAIDEQAQAERDRLLKADEKTLSTEDQIKRKALLDADAAEKAKSLPEKYDVKVPDDMKADMSLLDKMTPAFKELGLSQAQVQKLVDVYAPQVKAQTEAQAKAFQDAQEANYKAFLETERKNTLEKLGPNAKEQLAYAARSRDRFLSKETQELLNHAGISNNFNFISDLIRIGKLISEDKFVDGKSRASDQRTDGEVMYGKSNTKE